MTPTRSFLVLFSLFALALNTAGQLCSLDTLGASGVITDIAPGTSSFTTAGTILSGITSVYIEKSASAAGKLWVVASTNNAALRYKTAYDFTTGQAAEATIGTFNAAGATTGLLLKNPYALTTDNGGNCWVSDRSNKRVIIFSGCNTVTGAFTTSGTVIGAISNSVSGTAAATADPTGITASNGAAISVSNPVFLANGALSNKIYAFTKLPATLDANATSASNTSIYTNSLSGPLGIRFYTSVSGSNFLFIADFGNKRVQRVPLPTTGLPLTTASAVNFGSGGTSCVGASDIGGPSGVSFDTSTSTLFIADTTYNRITTIASGNTATTGSQVVFFPPAQGISTCSAGTVAQNTVNGPTDVDVGIFTSASITEATVVIADAANKRVLKLCSATNSLSVSLSISASAATMTGTGSLSLSLSPSFSTSNIGTPSISVSISGTLGGGSLSTTLSVTFSLTTSITTSFTTSLTLSNTFSRTFSLTTSQSYSLSLTNSFTGSYTNSYTNSLSTSVSTSYSTSGLIFCGDGIVNGKEKCDSGVLNGGKSSCCKKNCRLQRGGRVCLKQTNRCLTNRRCDGRGNCRASVVRVDSPCTLSTGLSGRCNSNAVCQA